MDRYTLGITDTNEIHVFKCKEVSEGICECEEVSLCWQANRESVREEDYCIPLEDARVKIAQYTNRGDTPCKDCLLILFGLKP